MTTIPTPQNPPSPRDDSLRDARGVPLTQGQRLAVEAAQAAEVRAYRTDPDVVALRVEQIRTQVARLMWTGIGLGLCFTMTNVQTFAAAGTRAGSLAWCATWLLDPTVSLVLLAVLRAEQVTARWQVDPGPWPRIAKWVLLLATYVMNTWTSWAAGSLSGVVLHSVPPLVVVIAAETVTDLQYALTECVHHAHTTATHQTQRAVTPAGADSPADQPANPTMGTPGERAAAPTGERAGTPAGERSGRRSVNAGTRAAQRPTRSRGEPARKPAAQARPGAHRKVLADYVAEAWAAWTPGVVVSPAWVRQVTDCSRGLSPKVAAALNTQLSTTPTATVASEPEGRAA